MWSVTAVGLVAVGPMQTAVMKLRRRFSAGSMLLEEVLLKYGHQVALEVDVNGISHSVPSLLLTPPCQLSLLVQSCQRCSRGRGWGQ